MSVLVAIFSAVFSSYMVSPDLYSYGPYEFEAEYSSLEECQLVSHGDDSICTTEKPYQLYLISDKPVNGEGKPLIYIPCDYWAGCFIQQKGATLSKDFIRKKFTNPVRANVISHNGETQPNKLYAVKVYDGEGNLKYVIPPDEVKKISTENFDKRSKWTKQKRKE